MSSPNDRKEEYVRDMFASIAPRYDLLNSLLSFNRHRYWRRFAVEKCDLRPGDSALDVGTGTGDLAIELARAVGEHGNVAGVDFCRPMLDIGAEKLNRLGIVNVQLMEGNAESLPVPSNSFKAATTGFTLRNVANIETALAEMTRAVEPGGRVVVLELAKPQGPVFRRIYDAYFHRLLPLVGGVVSGIRGTPPAPPLIKGGSGEHPPLDKGGTEGGSRGPYDYLPASVASFVSREELKAVMEKVGLSDVRVYDLTAGIVAVHVGIKI